MLRRASGKVDGLVIESPIAGGHNAPPRGKLSLDGLGQPVYGERDRVDLGELRRLGVPFWLAGGYGSPEKLRQALDEGAAGIQVGTAFALSDESGLRNGLKKKLLAMAAGGTAEVFTDPLASPTGFPFKVAQIAGTYSEAEVAEARTRVCDLGYLREPYWTADGRIAYRCPAEPEATYVAKGGRVEESVGRKCLCNALLANIGHPQMREHGAEEPPLVTVGDDVNHAALFLRPGREGYSAADVVEALMAGVGAPVGA
jgi:nitronate monooxygenase